MKRGLLLLLVLYLLAPQASAADAAAITSEPAGLGEAESPRRRTECALNLAEISKRLHAFAVAHNGALPSKLSEAYVGTSASALGELICPSARPHVVPGGFYPAYAYVNILPGGQTTQKDTADILVFDREPVHDGGRNVLLADLETVAYMKETELQSALAEQQRRCQAEGKEFVVVQDDFIPLRDPRDLQPGGAMGTSRHSFFASVHFKIAAALVLAIAAIAVVLVLRRRERSRTAAGRAPHQ